MFHDGDISSGIALAIQESKLVACFVRDDSADSSTWESEWLQDEELVDVLLQRAVLLRMVQGSQEAAFLAAFCPIVAVPAIIFIHNGQLQEHLQNGITQREFKERILKVLGISQVQPAPASPLPADPPVSSNPGPETSAANDTPREPPQASNTYQGPQDEEGAEAAARRAKAKGKQKVSDVKPDPVGTGSNQKLSYAALQRKKKREEKQELERVLALVEADKAARRAREQERRELVAGGPDLDRGQQSQRGTEQNKTKGWGKARKEVHLQIRVFDGSTLRRHFPRNATLGTDVRPWIDSELGEQSSLGKIPPFTFKHILPPAPARSLSISDEEAALDSIDLFPSATLVLVPVSGYAEAYGNAGGSVLGRVYGIIIGFFAMLLDALRAFVGMAQRRQPESQAQQAQPSREEPKSEANSGTARLNIRTLRDQRSPQEGDYDQQFYNGNQLNFEPPPPEDKPKEQDSD